MKVKVKNRNTNEIREVKIPGKRACQKDAWEGVSRCIGPCKCRIEVDGECPKGWPSRVEVYLLNAPPASEVK